jgi:uncharacterized protein with GYD domain
VSRYLLRVSYTTEGVKGLLKEGGSSRRSAVDAMIKKAGGSLEAFYFAFGDADVFVIAELPGNEAAAAASLTVAGSGAVSISTTVLLSPEEIDEAAKKSLDYRPPGA